MPYQRRYRRRRTYRRRPRRTSRAVVPKSTPWFTSAANAYDLARKAAQDIWYIKGLVNSEMHHLDATHTLGANQSAIKPMLTIAQGDDFINRTGRSILLKSINFSGELYVNSSVTTNSRVMIALVRDNQQIGATTPAITDIFTSATDPHTFLNANTLGRFTIIWRKQYTLSPNDAGDNVYTIRKYSAFHDHIRYAGAADTSIQKGGLYLCIITSEASNYPTVQISSRLSWHDN